MRVDISALWRSGSAGIQRVDQIRQKRRPVDAGLPRAERRTEVWIRHAPAAAIGVDDPLKRPTDAGDHLRQRGKVRRMVLGDQDVRVFGREPVPPRLRRCGGRFDAQESRDRLLLEPFAGVAGGDAGGARQLRRRDPPLEFQRLVEAELLAEIDAVELECVNGGLEQARRERVFAGLNNLAHRVSPLITLWA